MRKIVLILGALMLLLSCKKENAIDHGVSAEFPAQETLQSVSILFAESGSADILISETAVTGSIEGVSVENVDGGRIIRYRSLAIFAGTCAEEDLKGLMEETFWTAPSLQWIFVLQPSVTGGALSEYGFVNALRARGLSSEGVSLFAGSNVYDKMSALASSPLGFNVRVREGSL